MHLVTDMTTPPAEGMIRVKILKYVGHYKPDDVVDCTKDEATHLLTQNKVWNGSSYITSIRAVSIEAFEESQAAQRDPAEMTALDMAIAGKKNVVQTPHDPAFERHLGNIREGIEEKEEIKQAVVKAKSSKRSKKTQQQPSTGA